MNPLIFDDGDGIIIQFPLDCGLLFGVSMTDDAAQEMVNLIQNKLNARFDG